VEDEGNGAVVRIAQRDFDGLTDFVGGLCGDDFEAETLGLGRRLDGVKRHKAHKETTQEKSVPEDHRFISRE
jgi:hypothetical protein